MAGLKKSLGAIHLWGISVGLVISGDYFGWNYGWGEANFWEFFGSVLFVAIFYAVFSLSFTELATSMPHAGGPSAYAYHAFGPWGGFLAGFFTLVEFVLAPPAIAAALGGYFHFLVPAIPAMYASISFFVILIGMNLMGVKQTARFELIVTFIAVLGLLFYFFLTFYDFSWDRLHSRSQDTEFQWKSFFSAIPYAIWFFLAVEGVAMAAEEVKDPQKDIPRGYTAGIGTLILLAFGVLFLTAGNSDITEVSKLDYPLSFVLGSRYGIDSWQANLFTFIGLFGLVASLMGIILGYSRQIYSLAREGFLPRELGKVNKSTSVPALAVLFGGTLGILALGLGDTDQLITMAAMGACGMYVISMLSFFKLRFHEKKLKSPDNAKLYSRSNEDNGSSSRVFRVPFYPFFPAFALVAGSICLLAMATFHKELFFLLGILLFVFSILFKTTAQKRMGKTPRSLSVTEEKYIPKGDTDI